MSSLSSIPIEQSNYFIKDLRSYPSLEYRIERLKQLGRFLEENESELIEALRSDLQRPTYEIQAAELLPIQQEIKQALRKLPRWMKSIPAKTPLFSGLHWRAKAQVFPQPRGLCLILGPWNYPIQLLLSPLVASISAGNVNVLKASELAPASSSVLAQKLPKYFSPLDLQILEGGAEVSEKLTSKKFDFIFFTGGTDIGKKVMKAAAENLTPLVLELGGKCPVFLDESVGDLEVALRRILWGKMLNAGQTCVSPDYLLVPKSLFEKSIETLKNLYMKHYADPESYSRIVNAHHFDRLSQILASSEIIWSDRTDRSKMKMGLHLLRVRSSDEACMKQEIFGPLLPIYPYESKAQALDEMKQRPKPLALYYFGENSDFRARLKQETLSGALVQNDVVLHLTHPDLPFGGVGDSGFGSYHGFYGFQAFSHWKSIESKTLKPDFKLRYPPYPAKISGILRRFL